MTLIELFPLISVAVEVFKRFIPNKTRDWANPLLAILLGLGGAYATGGAENLVTGLGAAATSLAAYKIPKEIGKKVVKED